MTTPSPATIGVVAPHPFAAPRSAARDLDHKRPDRAAARLLGLALDVVVDLGALLLMVWLIPFVILAISSPILLILWAVLALIHRL